MIIYEIQGKIGHSSIFVKVSTFFPARFSKFLYNLNSQTQFFKIDRSRTGQGTKKKFRTLGVQAPYQWYPNFMWYRYSRWYPYEFKNRNPSRIGSTRKLSSFCSAVVSLVCHLSGLMRYPYGYLGNIKSLCRKVKRPIFKIFSMSRDSLWIELYFKSV